MSRVRPRSISGPIVVSTLTVVLTVALIVGWLVVVSLNTSLGGAFWSNRWLVAGGMVAAAFFVIVIALLVNPPTAFINKLQDRTKEKD